MAVSSQQLLLATMDEGQFRVVITALLAVFVAGYLSQTLGPQQPSPVSGKMLLDASMK